MGKHVLSDEDFNLSSTSLVRVVSGLSIPEHVLNKVIFQAHPFELVMEASGKEEQHRLDPSAPLQQVAGKVDKLTKYYCTNALLGTICRKDKLGETEQLEQRNPSQDKDAICTHG